MKPAHPTFCGVPPVETLEAGAADVVVYSASDCSPYRAGVESHAAGAPAAIRGALGWHSITRTRWDFDVDAPIMGAARVADYGVVLTDPDDPVGNREAIERRTREVVQADAIPVILGGDDSVPIPFLAGLAAVGRPLTVVQVDAHIDWRDELDGNRYGYSSTMRRASEMAHVENIVQVGIRGPGSASADEVATAKAWGAKIVPMTRLYAEGIRAAIDAVPEGADVVLCIDVDGLDPQLVPGVLLPAYGGLSYRDAVALFDGISRKARIVGANFVEFVPDRDPSGEGAKAIARLICCLVAMATRDASATG